MTPFERRHIGPGASEQQDMLAAVGVDALSTLIDRTIPAQIRLNRELRIDPALSEQAYLNHIAALGAKNKINKSKFCRYSGFSRITDDIPKSVYQQFIFKKTIMILKNIRLLQMINLFIYITYGI
jgi:glycine cleavage system pyridoxal-binding protein P